MITRRIVKVFLASPGDLSDERIAARDEVAEFNANWAEALGYQIELIGWEDTVSAYGRPQAIINRELEQCELFFGMMWKRWGTSPSKDGAYTSGFEEEFKRSLDRCKISGRPEMRMAFKNVDNELLRDPGPELTKVIKFRNTLIENKEILFENFSTPADFRPKFRKSLTKYINELRRREEQTTEHTPESKIDARAEKSEQPGSAISNGEIIYLRDIASKLETDGDYKVLSALEIARLRLIANSVKKHNNDEQNLGVHDANLIYLAAEKLSLGRSEKFGLIDAGLSKFGSQTAPLWHWYKAIDGFKNGYLPLFTVVGSISARVGALSAMRATEQKIQDSARLSREICLDSWFGEHSPDEIRIAALSYLQECGIQADTGYIETEVKHKNYQVRNAATEALLKILIKNSLESALCAINKWQPDSISPRIIREIFSEPSKLEDGSLLAAVQHRHSEVRGHAIIALRQRSRLADDLCERLIVDTSPRVRFEALKQLQDRGRIFSDQEARSILVKPSAFGLFGSRNYDGEGEANFEQFRMHNLMKLGFVELTKIIDDSSPYDITPYIARGQKFYTRCALDLKENVGNGFVDYCNTSFKKYSSVNSDDSTINLRDISDFLAKKMTRKCLTIIISSNDVSDIQLVRRSLASDDITSETADFKYLSRFGEWQDIQLIENIIDRSANRSLSLLALDDFDNYIAAAEAIHKIAKGRLHELLSLALSSRLLRYIIVLAPEREFNKLTYDTLSIFLHHDDDDLRKIAAAKIAKCFGQKDLKAFLSKYITSETYFYNVTYWFDFAVNSPRPVIDIAAAKFLREAI